MLFPIVDIAWMMVEDGLPQVGSFYVGIDFRGADILVSQQCLNHPQVGSSLEQGGGETVAQGMGRDGLLDACILSRILDHDENHVAGEMGTSAVQEDIVFLAGFNLHQVAVDIPQVDFLQRLFRDGNQPLLLALSHHPDELLDRKSVV